MYGLIITLKLYLIERKFPFWALVIGEIQLMIKTLAVTGKSEMAAMLILIKALYNRT